MRGALQRNRKSFRPPVMLKSMAWMCVQMQGEASTDKESKGRNLKICVMLY